MILPDVCPSDSRPLAISFAGLWGKTSINFQKWSNPELPPSLG